MRRWLSESGNLGVSNGAEEFEGYGSNEQAASQYKQRSGLVCAAWGKKRRARPANEVSFFGFGFPEVV